MNTELLRDDENVVSVLRERLRDARTELVELDRRLIRERGERMRVEAKIREILAILNNDR